ncbi:MAG: outer membrane lipid asymmetry maintenance protein MlaD [Hyphomonadaceae bacterium]|nr:outer membrane lipid asymmetry maintenance protein MlaD [Hyphomonadaceae bacterium]
MSAQKEQAAETILGAIVAAVAIGFLGFAITRAGSAEAAGGYELFARFQRADGVAVGSDVRISGVKVGAVREVALDPETFYAKVTLTLDPVVKLPDDSSAKVASDGLLGGAYVSLDAGGSEAILTPGSEILNTQGSVDLLSLLAAAAGGGSGGGAGGGDSATEGATP